MRNPAITILKAIAIILVVLAQSGSPAPISAVASMLCVSLFFLSAGYCFNPKYLNDTNTFIGRRLKSLYLPFVTCSIVFLLLNSFWFATGILNEQYGTAQGGVAHPLDLHNGLQALWSIVFNMSGYDAFLCGSYWFFRTLFVSSLAFVFLLKLAENVRWFRSRLAFSASIVALLAVALALWQISDGLKVTGLAQGGYREFMAIFFLAAGFIYRRFELWLEAEPFDDDYEERLDSASSEFEEEEAEEEEEYVAAVPVVPVNVPTAAVSAAASAEQSEAPSPRKRGGFIATALTSSVRMVCATPFLTVPLALGILIGIIYVGAPSLTPSATQFSSPLLLALGGVAGFSLVYNLSALLSRVPRLNKILAFIGENTLYVLLFHLLAFKFVSMLKVGVYGLQWNMIGGYPVVHSDEGAWFWILYTIVGLALPLGIVWAIKYCAAHYNIHNYIALAKAIGRFLVKSLRLCGHWIVVGSKSSVRWLWKGLHWLCVESWASIYNFCIRFVDTVKDGADINQDNEEDTDDEDDDDDDEEEEEEEEEYDEEEYEEEE